MLDVHGGLLAWTVITFFILLVVLKKIAWGPIISTLESREKEIKDALNAADRAKEDAEKVQKDYEKVVAKARAEAQTTAGQTEAAAGAAAASRRTDICEEAAAGS